MNRRAAGAGPWTPAARCPAAISGAPSRPPHPVQSAQYEFVPQEYRHVSSFVGRGQAG